MRAPSTNNPSNVAQSFSEDLDAVFGMNAQLRGLASTVEEKKRTVSSQSQELAELDAKLRETEERLAQVSRSSSRNPTAAAGAAGEGKKVASQAAGGAAA
ncbi:hypothetical protein M8818_001588 [Zalaria obscura]|uniref:Uncharacterized protein n=1 Tax=Zalaria obscura TaxID=2024903 RepID=A0ACC3SM72_9PEZI